jgi:hypothetical protein
VKGLQLEVWVLNLLDAIDRDELADLTCTQLRQLRAYVRRILVQGGARRRARRSR